LQLLLAHRADPNVIGSDGNTPLGRTVFARRADLAAILLKHGADPNQQLQLQGRPTVLALAVNEQAAEVVATLLKAGADPWPIDSDSYVALEKTDEQTRRMILEARARKPRPTSPSGTSSPSFSPSK
jgi:ankyrin repeat protein